MHAFWHFAALERSALCTPYTTYYLQKFKRALGIVNSHDVLLRSGQGSPSLSTAPAQPHKTSHSRALRRMHIPLSIKPSRQHPSKI